MPYTGMTQDVGCQNGSISSAQSLDLSKHDVSQNSGELKLDDEGTITIPRLSPTKQSAPIITNLSLDKALSSYKDYHNERDL